MAEANSNVLGESVYAVECHCCLEEFKVKDKKSKLQCMFCAQIFCAKCRYKSREFPRSRQFPKEKGDCCKICDNKFFIQEMLKDKHLQIEAQTNQLLGEQGMQSQVDRAE